MASGEQLPRLQLSEVRGLDGVKEASVTIRANPEGPLKNTEVRRAAEGTAARRAALGGPAKRPGVSATAGMHANIIQWQRHRGVRSSRQGRSTQC